MPAQYGSLPFAEAIAFFRQKQSMPSERWADLWRDAHNRAFMVAGAMETDLLADLRQLVDDAIAQGTSLTAFKRDFTDLAGRHGWDFTGPAGWRSRVIYETNVRQAYNAGREQQIEAVKHLRPYALYQHGDSLHPRLHHLAWHNLVLRVDDPWWDTHTPSNGWGCKCKKYTLSARQLAARGLTLGKAPPLDPREWVDKATGEVHQVPTGIDPGFDYRPKTLAEANTKLERQQAAKPPLAQRLPQRQFVDSAFSTVKGVNAHGLDALLASLPDHAQPQLAKFKRFLDKTGLKTVFLKQGELSRRSNKAAEAVNAPLAEFLGLTREQARYYCSSRRPKTTGGFTYTSQNHVVVKVAASHKLAKADGAIISQQVAQVLSDARNDSGPRKVFLGQWGPVGAKENYAYRHWTFSEAIRELDPNAALLSTWLHEVGHQVHYWAHSPELPQALKQRALFVTQYSHTNKYEFFAEHFVAWLLDRPGLAKWSPKVADWLDEVVDLALQSKSKRR